MAIYTTAAIVRACHDALSSTNLTALDDTAIATYVTSHVHPDIEGALSAAGFSVPVTDTYSIMALTEGYLGAAAILRRYAQQMYGGNGGVAEMLEAEGRKRMAQIIAGTIDIGATRDSSGNLIVVDQDPDTRPESETYVTRDPGEWLCPDEERA